MVYVYRAVDLKASDDARPWRSFSNDHTSTWGLAIWAERELVVSANSFLVTRFALEERVQLADCSCDYWLLYYYYYVYVCVCVCVAVVQSN